MAATADAADEAKLESFLQWMQANGADLRGSTIRACGGGKGFGVFSTAAPEPVATDGVVMVVPLDLTVTPMRVLQDPLVGPRCRALFEEGGVDDRLLVTLFLTLFLYGYVIDNNPDDFLMEFMSTLRTIAMQDHELEQVASLLGEVGSSEDREPSDAEIQSAVWEVCGDQGALGLLVDLLGVKMAELEEGSGTEASDTQLLEEFDSIHSEDYMSGRDENSKRKLKINNRSCIVYRRGQKQLTRLFLREAEYLLELSSKEQT